MECDKNLDDGCGWQMTTAMVEVMWYSGVVGVVRFGLCRERRRSRQTSLSKVGKCWETLGRVDVDVNVDTWRNWQPGGGWRELGCRSVRSAR